MKIFLNLVFTLMLTVSSYASDLKGNEALSPHKSIILSDSKYQELFRQAKDKDDYLRILGDIAECGRWIDIRNDSEDSPLTLPSYDDPTMPSWVIPPQFFLGFDRNELIFTITARTSGYYEILSLLQDCITESGLATNLVHIADKTDTDKFPCFQKYFSLCTEKGILGNTIAIDLTRNLNLLEYLNNPENTRKGIRVNSILENLSGDKLNEYSADFRKKIIINYSDQLSQNETFSQALDEIHRKKEGYTIIELHSAMKTLVDSHRHLLEMNDYNTITPKQLSSFQSLLEFSDPTEQKQAPLKMIVNKITAIQDYFEKLKKNHKPLHQTWLKEIIKDEKLVPLSILQCMDCKSNFLNHHANEVLPEILSRPDLKLHSLSDIESFIRMFHEKATVLHPLEIKLYNKPTTINLLDMHLALRRIPLSKDHEKTLSDSYRVMGITHIDNDKPIYAMPVNQYVILNLIYQLLHCHQTTPKLELEHTISTIEKIISEDNTVIIPKSLYKQANSMDNKICFDQETKQLILPQNLIAIQQSAIQSAITKFLSVSNPRYYIYDQGGQVLFEKDSFL